VLLGFILLSLSNFTNAGAFSDDPDSYMPVDIPILTIKVPNDSSIIRMNQQGLIRDFGTLNKWDSLYFQNGAFSGAYISSQNITPSQFTVHVRVSQNVTSKIAPGTGIKYNIGYTITDDEGGAYSVSLKPIERGSYVEGLFGTLGNPPPSFSDADLMRYLRRNGLTYKFEIDSPYPTDAVYANFERLANPISIPSKPDSVTGKIFNRQFSMKYGDAKLKFSMENFPYHNGSKAVIYALVPAVETAPGIVDYSIIFADVKRKLEAIAKN
jgi:hypothetical protein